MNEPKWATGRIILCCPLKSQTSKHGPLCVAVGRCPPWSHPVSSWSPHPSHRAHPLPVLGPWDLCWPGTGAGEAWSAKPSAKSGCRGLLPAVRSNGAWHRLCVPGLQGHCHCPLKSMSAGDFAAGTPESRAQGSPRRLRNETLRIQISLI